MTNLREKIMIAHHPVIFYEIIPPPERAKPTNVEAYAQCAIELLDSSAVHIDAINIPDIREEHREDKPKGTEYVSKSDAREFGKRLQLSSHKSLDILVNRCTVHEDLPTHFQWLKDTVEKFDIHNMIIVGGESSKVKYPGPSVIQLTQIINETYKSSLFCGGIVIQSRPNEAVRLVEKGLAGINFFTSQITYEPYIIKKVLKEYHELCVQKGIQPKRIFLSFAPVSSLKDLEFLRWLGVVLPEEVEKIIFEADIGIGWRSMKIAKAVLESILQFMHDEKINVPLGLNIEHISRHNFELSKEFIEELGTIYYHSYETKYNIFD